MPGLDLNAIIQQAALVNNQQAAGAEQIAGLSNQAAGVAQRAADSTRATGQFAADVARTEATYQLETENRNIALANAFGTNQGASSDVITRLGESMRGTALQLVEQQNKVSEIEANSDLINNPVGWLRDLLQGDGERAKRDALAGQFDVLAKTNQNLNAATQQGVQTQNAIKQTVNQDSINSLVGAKKVQADAQAAQSELEAIKFQIQGVNTLANIGADAFSRNMQVYNAALNAEQIADAREDRKLRLSQFRKQVADDKADLEYYTAATDRIKKGAALAGRTETNVTVEEVTRQYKQGGPRAAFLQEFEQIGFGLEEQGGVATGLLGKTPFEAAQKYASLGGRADAAWSQGSLKIVDQAMNTALTKAQESARKTGKKVTAEDVSVGFNQEIDAIASQGALNVSQAAGHYNAIPELTTVVASKDTALNPAGKMFADTVVNDLILSGNTNPEAELVLATGIKWVQDGKMSEKQLKEGMINFYKGALSLKGATGGYNAFMMPMPDSYFINVNRIVGDQNSWANKFGSGFGAIAEAQLPETFGEIPRNAVRFNILNPADFDVMLTAAMSKDRAAKIRQGAAQ